MALLDDLSKSYTILVIPPDHRLLWWRHIKVKMRLRRNILLWSPQIRSFRNSLYEHETGILLSVTYLLMRHTYFCATSILPGFHKIYLISCTLYTSLYIVSTSTSSMHHDHPPPVCCQCLQILEHHPTAEQQSICALAIKFTAQGIHCHANWMVPDWVIKGDTSINDN